MAPLLCCSVLLPPCAVCLSLAFLLLCGSVCCLVVDLLRVLLLLDLLVLDLLLLVEQELLLTQSRAWSLRVLNGSVAQACRRW